MTTNGRGNNVACSLTQMVQHGSTRTHPVQYSNVACSRTQMVQHGPTSTHLVQYSICGLLPYANGAAWSHMHPSGAGKSHHADRGRVRLVSTPTSPALGILVYSCIPEVGTWFCMQTEEGFASFRRPQAQRFRSWCAVASFKLAHVSPRRQKKVSAS